MELRRGVVGLMGGGRNFTKRVRRGIKVTGAAEKHITLYLSFKKAT